MATPLDDPFPWQALLGRAHVVLLHLPLGLLPAIAMLEFGSALFRRPAPRGAVLALAWLAAFGAGLAVASGLLLSGEGGYGDEAIRNHKIGGISLVSLAVLAAVLAFGERRLWFRLALLAALAVMVPTGHLGGAMSHGNDFLLEPYLDWQKARAKGEGGDTTTSSPQDPEPLETRFEREIRPILERTCVKCHNPKKTKAELLLTTIEGIRAGSENGPVLVPGDPDDSELLVRLEFPLDDEDHMPPEGKPQPSAEEVATIRAWIADGAPFDR